MSVISYLKKGWMKTLFFILTAIIILFIALPIVAVFAKPFFADLLIFFDSVTSFQTWQSVFISLSAAFFSVLIGFIFGVPAAYLLSGDHFPGKKIIEGIIDLPMAIPHTVAGVALLVVLGSGGFVGSLTEPAIQFSGSYLGIVVAMTFISIPFMINSAKEGFETVNPKLVNVARNLGSSKWEAFYRIEFPLAFPHIFNGAIMSWARAISEFSAVIILVTFYPMIAPGLIWSELYSKGLIPALAVAVVLLSVLLPCFVILRYFRKRFFDRY